MKKSPDKQNDSLTDLEKAAIIAGERAMKRLAEMISSSPQNKSQPKDNLPPPPERCNFESEEEYEEAKGYYGTHIGRIRKLAEQARASRDSSDND